MANERTCISCGMPLRQLSDYAANDPQKNWCRHCAREDGSMKSYEEVLDGMSAFLARRHRQSGGPHHVCEHDGETAGVGRAAAVMNRDVAEIRRRLKDAADPAVLASMRRAVPDTKMLGVKVPLIRCLASTWAKERPMDFEAARRLFTALCADDLREEILFGTFLLAGHKKRLREIEWRDIDAWLDHIDNWETCDQLASNVVASSVAANTRLQPLIRGLAKSTNVWRKRFAVATAASLNQRGRFVPELTLQICQDLMNDDNPAIRQAVGWALRELSKKDEELAFAFLREHRDGMPRSLMREASEKLTAGRRKELLT